MFHSYPHSLYYSDIDKMCGMCHKAGYKLEVAGDRLRLVDSKGKVVSDVEISFSSKAMYDIEGKPIRSYILSASTGATTLVLTHGDGKVTTLEIPFAKSSKEDTLGKDLTRYAYSVGVSENNLLITRGDGETYTVTVPFAVKAAETVDGFDLTTVAATLAVDGDNVVLRDTKGRELSRITPNYAIRSTNDGDGDEISSTYGATLETGTTTVLLKSKENNTLSEIVVPFSTSSLQDTDGNRFISDYVEKLVVDGDAKRIGVEAHDGTRLSTITVPFATEATDATNAIKTVQVIGDTLVFTTHGGVSYTIQCPYALKSRMDDNSNIIKEVYVSNVINDEETGAIKFYNAVGEIITELIPTVNKANRDSYNNLIADYVKTIAVDNQSNFVTVTHGTGDTDTLTINFANHAWMDSLNQPIQNTYLTNITFEFNEEQGRYEMVLWNGDIPRAEVGRVVVIADRARADKNGRDLTDYIGNVEADGNHIDIVNGNDETVNRITAAVDVVTVEANTISSWTYDTTEKALVWQPGTPVVVAEESREVAFDNM